MKEAVLDVLTTLLGSPWWYVALFSFSAIDGFFPVVPSESLVITAGVFAANGTTNLALVIAVSAAGAVLGDHVSYFVGRFAGAKLLRHLRTAPRRQAAFDWASGTLAERGGLILVIARYIPGGRTVTTLTAGMVGYPLYRFTCFDLLAGVSWGAYSGLIGYSGGIAFERNPILGLLFGLGLALSVTVLVEAGRWLYRRRRPESDEAEPESSDAVTSSR
ncbi:MULTISPECIES: DedA family protein [unclassified Saccharopolyspora]|uniref:DedA family protein n=1 Tax=unclassified Saccharopolyspora TaxID=2646250 RepID=UPI001CD41B5D|nr:MULTISPECIES: DedA family protein [unclassified Saccharopolyspora]MCA1185158.1 DedA family protein [Saccharopolyspora sp. 6T]MCA1191366.1 DedA family protein [Saccharopolyspora sp. 6V]MCA1278476.1 DedA family protein [Saccharopolyspora sp. 7B]